MPAEAGHRSGHNPHDAMHPPWRLARNSAIWVDSRPVRANLVPVGAEMCDWLGQKGQLTVVTEGHRGLTESYTNPYTYYATSLATQLAAAINEIIEFAESNTPMNAFEAEMRRIRLESELSLNFARFCEAAMKQMLHCTDFRTALYKKAALGPLLSQDCRECRKKGNLHSFSLLGALSHHYFQCHSLEHCLYDHLKIAGGRRNSLSAHSDTDVPKPTTAAESREMAASQTQIIGHDLGHMAQHLGEIEKAMIAEIDLRIAHWPSAPPLEDLLKIPVRLEPPKSSSEGS